MIGVLGLVIAWLSLGCGDSDPQPRARDASTKSTGSGKHDAAARADASDMSEISDESAADVRECRHTADCPEPDNPGECAIRRCLENRCTVEYAARGTELTDQSAQDCRKRVCDGEGHEIDVPDDADTADDDNACTRDSCSAGSVLHTAEPAGTACDEHRGKLCSKAGRCVACIQASDCSSHVCQDGTCRPALCGNSELDPDEADVDCGGSCAACGPGRACTQASDCAGMECTGKTCMANCSNGVKNGTESDVDCGADCPSACGNGQHCRKGTDCVSSFCLPGMARCVEPACDDGYMNGDETDVDCGGGCPPCPVACEWSHECSATDVCYPNLCVHSVNGCSIGTATDLRNMPEVSITFDGNGYVPSCILVTMYTQVTFEGSFADYPLIGGQIKDGKKQPASSGPFVPVTSSGDSQVFSMDECAVFPFYCDADGVSNMAGTVFVVSP